MIKKLLRKIRSGFHAMRNNTAHPNGHFYSPVTDRRDLTARMRELYPPDATAPGVVFDDAGIQHTLQEVFTPMLLEYDYPEHGAKDTDLNHFYSQNSQFSGLDSRALFALLRAWRPARIVEVGSGYSSLLMADINRRFQGGSTVLECVEPYPRPFLKRPDAGIRLHEQRVQEIPMAFFESLQSGDLLFIDSSHVAKTGSDVNYLYLQVLPRLQRGVKIHIHDIFIPEEYPAAWTITENRSWNEQYLLQALLIGSSMFKVLFACHYAHLKFPQLVKQAVKLPQGNVADGGSFYLARI